MTGAPTTPTPSPDAGRVALDAMAKDTAWAQGISQTTARAIVAHVSALEARLAEYGTEGPNRYHARLAAEMEVRALAAEGEVQKLRGAAGILMMAVALDDKAQRMQLAEEVADALLPAAHAALTPPTERETP